MSIRRGRAEDPPAAADEHAQPAAAGPEVAPADGGAEVPAAYSAAEAASGGAGPEAAPGAAGTQVAPADGEVQIRPADGEVQTPPADGVAEAPSANGHARTLSAGGYAGITSADGGGGALAAEEHPPWPADDATALSQNGDTLVLPVLGDIDDVTAPPGAGQHHQNSSPSRPYLAVGGTVALLDDRLAASGIDYKAYSALAGPLHRNRREWLATRLIAFVLVILDIRFLYWLIFQSKYPHLNGWQWHTSAHAAVSDAYLLLLAAMTIGSIVMQIFLLVTC